MLDHALEPYFPTQFRWLGYLIMLASVLFLFQGSWFWPLIGVLGGIFLGWAKTGTQLHFDKKRIKQYVGVWGIKFGSWQEIPQLDKITITKTRYSQVLGSRGTSSSFKSTTYRAFLRGKQNYKAPFCSDSNPEKVLEEARNVAKLLNLRILDCTIKAPQWIT